MKRYASILKCLELGFQILLDGLGELVYPNFWINFGTNSEKGRNWSGLCWDQFPEQKIVKLCEQDQWFKIGLELFPTQFPQTDYWSGHNILDNRELVGYPQFSHHTSNCEEARPILKLLWKIGVDQYTQTVFCGKKIPQSRFVEFFGLWKKFVEFTKKFHKLFRFVEN